MGEAGGGGGGWRRLGACTHETQTQTDKKSETETERYEAFANNNHTAKSMPGHFVCTAVREERG